MTQEALLRVANGGRELPAKADELSRAVFCLEWFALAGLSAAEHFGDEIVFIGDDVQTIGICGLGIDLVNRFDETGDSLGRNRLQKRSSRIEIESFANEWLGEIGAAGGVDLAYCGSDLIGIGQRR